MDTDWRHDGMNSNLKESIATNFKKVKSQKRHVLHTRPSSKFLPFNVAASIECEYLAKYPSLGGLSIPLRPALGSAEPG